MNKIARVLSGGNRIALWLLFWLVVVLSGLQIHKMTYAEEQVRQPYVAQIDIYGEIQEGLTDQLKGKITEAYEDLYAKVIILHIISEGGSPAESWRLCTFLDQKRREEAKKPEGERRQILAVIGSVGASAAYMIAVCTDGIYATPSSLVGSVGAVIHYQKSDEKTKYIASGSAKVPDLNTPFGKKIAEEFVRLEAAQFLEGVIASRGSKLKAKREELQSGRLWYGQSALDQGLIDGFASPESVARDHQGIPILYVGVQEPTVWDKLKDVLSGIHISVVQKGG